MRRAGAADDPNRCSRLRQYLILNLTTPRGHYPINRQCLLAGKSVYCEKPLSLTCEQGKELYTLANEKGLWLGCAPPIPTASADRFIPPSAAAIGWRKR